MELTSSARRRIGWRAPVATILIVLDCVLAPVAVLGVWSANQVSDTSRYIANIEPLIHDPAVQNALTDKVTNEITSHLNVTGLTNQAATLLTDKGLNRVGTLLQSFGPSIASAVNGFIHDQVSKIVTSPQFANTWIQVNNVAHQAVVKALSGQGNGTVKISNGQVVIDLGPFINIVKQSLVARGFTVINSLPAINPTLPLFSARELTKAQSAYRLINDLKIVLPILSLLLIGLGVYLARSHRRALIGAGLGFAASMLVLGAGAAFLTGPSTTATSIRKALKSGMEWIRQRGEHAGVTTGPVGTWTYAHRKGLRIGTVALAALIFVFWGRPTALVVILIAILLLVVLGLIELIGRPPAKPATADQP